MTKFKKTQLELEEELTEQVQALRSSLLNFDKGDIWEAKRIASSIYLLCFDGTGRTKSLLGMLKIKSGLKFISSVSFPKTTDKIIYASASPMVCMGIHDKHGARYFPILGDSPLSDQMKQISFSTWWEEEILHPTSRLSMIRKNLVFIMRSQDGGAHVDDHLRNFDYKILKSQGDPVAKWHDGSVVFGGSAGEPITGIIWAIMRQIGWELDQTLQKHGI